MADSATRSQRFLALDVFRGLTIAGMIVVNDPGDWGAVYAPLLHADWHGLTPTDLVFPFFLFIVGVSVVLAYTKRLDRGDVSSSMYVKVFMRAALIFGLGILLALFPEFDFSDIRIPGVLQRIAIVFLVCSLLFLNTDRRTQIWIAGLGLVGYWLAMALLPIPIDDVIREALATGEVMRSAGFGRVPVDGLQEIGTSYIAANYEPGVNLEAWVDRRLIPGRMWEVTWDPEGVLSTLPAICTGILGMLAGHLLVAEQDRSRQAFLLLLGGYLAVVLGGVWDWFFPYNKNLWSSSFVMATAGWASMTLGMLLWALDVKGWTRWMLVPKAFGANAITAYVLHGTLGRLFVIPIGEEGPTLKGAFMSSLKATGLEAEFASLLWALLYTAIVFLPIWWLYRRKIFLKL